MKKFEKSWIKGLPVRAHRTSDDAYVNRNSTQSTPKVNEMTNQIVANKAMPLTPSWPDYQGVLALTTTQQTSDGFPLWDVAAYVDHNSGAVTWTPLSQADLIIDIPSGFDFGNGDALLDCIEAWDKSTRPEPGSVAGHP